MWSTRGRRSPVPGHPGVRAQGVQVRQQAGAQCTTAAWLCNGARSGWHGGQLRRGVGLGNVLAVGAVLDTSAAAEGLILGRSASAAAPSRTAPPSTVAIPRAARACRAAPGRPADVAGSGVVASKAVFGLPLDDVQGIPHGRGTAKATGRNHRQSGQHHLLQVRRERAIPGFAGWGAVAGFFCAMICDALSPVNEGAPVRAS